MDACTLVSVLIVLGVLLVLGLAVFGGLRTSSPRRRFEYCPSCDATLPDRDDQCPECGLDLLGKLADRLERIRLARLEIRQLEDEGELDAETAGRVTEQLRLRKRSLTRGRRPSVEFASPTREQEEAPAFPPPSPPPLPQSPRPRYAEILAPDQQAFPPEAPAAMLPPVVQPPRRSFGQVLHERNILWGELAGGLLIVGCSIALVLSLWQTLEELPYFTFLLSAGITSAVFGAGYYTFHHWKLAGTSRGLLVISLLLTPLNLLLLADPGARGTTDVLDFGVKIVAMLVFAWIVRTGGRDLLEADEKPRRWWLALAVVGAPASQMIPTSVFSQQPVWLPVVCFALACAFTVGRLSRDRRKPDVQALHEDSAASILMFVGIAVFGLFAAWGFVVSRADDLPATQCALRPQRDPFGPSSTGRTGYVYLAEILLVLLFAHVRLNVPQAFTGQAVKYWTFIVMLLAFVGVGLAELFARRGLRVLAQPLLKTGVLLPLIPLLVFWAKPPDLVFEFAENKAPGLVPLLGYLQKVPQHFDVYALLWFLAGMLYGLIALSRQSFGWALLGALATNAGLWALLSHNGVPAIVHPQAWAIPLALIVLVSEHVNRHRLKASVASGLRYLGISMIYVASASDLFIAGVGQSLWMPVILAVFCVAGVLAGVYFRVRAFLYLGLGFLLLDVFSMIWHAAVNREQTWVWYASGIVLGAIILALFAVLEKRRNDVRDLISKLREWQ